MAKWGLDAGHGGPDPGSINLMVKEKDLNLIVILEVAMLLSLHDEEVILTRDSDIYLLIGDRCRIVNEAEADYAISVHHNGGGGDGHEIIHSILQGKGKALATMIYEEFEAIGQNGRRIFSRANSAGKDYHGMIRLTDMPTVITEFGFVDNAKDFEQFNEYNELMMEAQAIVKACLRMVGKTFNPTPDFRWKEIIRLTQNSPDKWIIAIEELIGSGNLYKFFPQFIENIYDQKKS